MGLGSVAGARLTKIVVRTIGELGSGPSFLLHRADQEYCLSDSPAPGSDGYRNSSALILSEGHRTDWGPAPAGRGP